MSFDSLMRKSISGVVLAFVALIAYFHASLAMQFVTMALLERSFPASKTASAHADAASAQRDPTRSTAILTRNAFDSVTGPLTPVGDVSVDLVKKPKALADPLLVPLCDGIAASITTESSDRSWSLASLQADGEARPRMRRVGDNVGTKQIAFIGYNPRENSPAVWLANGDELCQVVLFRGAPVRPPESAPAAKSSASSVPPEISSRIHKLSDAEYHIDRQVVDLLLEDQGQVMKGVRVVPERKDGAAVGIRLFGIRPDSLLGMLGLQSGDRLDSINGYNVANPEKALEAYAHLRAATNLSMLVNRKGASVGVDYRIQ